MHTREWNIPFLGKLVTTTGYRFVDDKFPINYPHKVDKYLIIPVYNSFFQYEIIDFTPYIDHNRTNYTNRFEVVTSNFQRNWIEELNNNETIRLEDVKLKIHSFNYTIYQEIKKTFTGNFVNLELLTYALSNIFFDEAIPIARTVTQLTHYDDTVLFLAQKKEENHFRLVTKHGQNVYIIPNPVVNSFPNESINMFLQEETP